ERIFRRDELAARVAGSSEWEEEAIGTAVDELERDAAPGFVRVVVDEGPTLECGLFFGSQHEAVARAPDGGFADVAEREGLALCEDTELLEESGAAAGERVERRVQT